MLPLVMIDFLVDVVLKKKTVTRDADEFVGCEQQHKSKFTIQGVESSRRA